MTTNLHERATAIGVNTVDGEAPQVNKRRSLRVVIDIPVTVFGQDLDGKIFAEQSKTITVNAHGAIVILETDINRQKPALLMNTKTGAEVQCSIAHRKEIAKGRFEIGLNFVDPNPRFWGMNFPPEDWNPAERKKATSHHVPKSPSPKSFNR